MYQKTNYGRISSGLIVWTNSLGQVSTDFYPVDLSDFQPIGGLQNLLHRDRHRSTYVHGQNALYSEVALAKKSGLVGKGQVRGCQVRTGQVRTYNHRTQLTK